VGSDCRGSRDVGCRTETAKARGNPIDRARFRLAPAPRRVDRSSHPGQRLGASDRLKVGEERIERGGRFSRFCTDLAADGRYTSSNRAS